MSPLVIVDAVVDTVLILLLLRFGLRVGQSIAHNYTRLPDLGRIISLATVVLVLILAYKLYETPIACLAVTPSDLSSVGKNVVPANLEEIMRVWGPVMKQLTKLESQNATGDTLVAYQQMAVAVLRQPPDIYGWTFLILIAIPVVGIVVFVSRNLDALTELILHPASTAPAPSFAGGPRGGRRIAAPPNAGRLSSEDTEKLIKLKSLLDAGVISKDDFESQKKKILGLTSPVATPTTESEELRKLKALLDSGALTEEEYETQKKRFLEQL